MLSGRAKYDWELCELQKVTTGTFPKDPNSIDGNCYRSRVVDWDLRYAESLCKDNHIAPIERVRSFISTGKIELAKEAIRAVTAQGRSIDRAEALLEESRLLNARGLWNEAILFASKSLENPDLHPVSRMTLYQVLANAFFEAGRFEDSLGCLRRFSELSHIMPHAVSVFYAAVLEARVLARTIGIEVGKNKIQSLWLDGPASAQSADRALTLLRAEIDLARMQSKNALDLAIGSYFLASHLGDELYKGLALLDVIAESKPGSIPRLSITAELRQFERISRLHDEVESESSNNAVSTSGRMLRVAFNQKSKPVLPQVFRNFFNRTDAAPEVLISSELGLCLQFKPLSYSFFEASQRTSLGLKIISDHGGKIDKEQFFCLCWKQRRFHRLKHDGLIRQFVFRAKKEAGIQLLSQDGMILFR